MTEVLPATAEGIVRAAQLLAGGALVAFPTDTVHGLACRAGDSEALERLFALKGRPPDRQVAWLVKDMAQAESLRLAVDDRARAATSAFWPGGLTLVLPRHDGGERSTLGVRAPDHSVTQALLAASGPMPVSSANPHGFPECFTADDVLVAFAGAADELAAVVAGDSPGGVASSVLDLSGARPRLLREGAIGRGRLEAVVGPID